MARVNAAPAAATRVRDWRLDFFRGSAMFIIFIAHCRGNYLWNFIPARFGPSDAADMFGDYDAAEITGRRAVMLDPGDIWAAHAVAQICEMEDRPDDDAAWIAAQQQHWDETNNFALHVFWPSRWHPRVRGSERRAHGSSRR